MVTIPAASLFAEDAFVAKTGKDPGNLNIKCLFTFTFFSEKRHKVATKISEVFNYSYSTCIA